VFCRSESDGAEPRERVVRGEELEGEAGAPGGSQTAGMLCGCLDRFAAKVR
jgi:hypothetical protein